MSEKKDSIPFWVIYMPGLLIPFAAISFHNRTLILEKTIVLFVLAAGGILFTRWLVLKDGTERLRGFFKDRIYTIFLVFVFVHFAVFLVIALIKLYSFSYCDPDTAFLEQSFWHTGQGRFFYRTHAHGLSGFGGGHASFIFTFIWPVYYLIPRMETLFVLRSIFVSAGAFPLFALAKKRLGAPLALVLVAGYLLHPIIVGQLLRGPYSPHFSLVFFLGAFWAIDNNRLKTFWVMIALFLLSREDYAMTVLMFTFYLWWKKRDWRWAVFPLPIALIWFFLMMKFVLPGSTDVGTYRFSAMYSQWGGSLFEIGWNILTHPVDVVRAVFTFHHVYFFYYLLLPFGLVLLLWRSPEFLIAIPVFFIVTLCADDRTSSLENYYALPIVIVACISSLYGLERWGNKLKEKIPKEKLYAAVGVTLFILSFWALWRVILVPHILNDKITRPYYAGEKGPYVNRNEAMREALEVVPPNASLMLPRYLGLFSARRPLLVFDGRSDYINDLEYFIIDERTKDVATRERYQTAPELLKLLGSSDVEKDFEKDGVVVYKRVQCE